MPFVAKPEDPIVPVRDGEIVAPTRVVHYENGKLAARIFPTEARAWAYAAELPRGASPIVQPASERAPAQIGRTPRQSVASKKYDVAARIELVQAYRSANAGQKEITG